MKPRNIPQKIAAVVGLFVVLAVGLHLMPAHLLTAQLIGNSTVVGATNPVNQYQPASATGLAGAVTNPASNFIIQIAGGPIYFAGGITEIGQSTLTLPANSTNLVVWDGVRKQLYAKQAVTGPGSSSAGVPASVLYPIPGIELALATVVCNGTACGNGGNGTITDARSLVNFPAGGYVGGHLNQAAAGTTSAGAGVGPGIGGICTAAAATTCVVTFSNAYQVAPSCTVTDQTNAIVFKALPTTTTLTITAASNSDTWSWHCDGNPN